jgi:hypothetical protein
MPKDLVLLCAHEYASDGAAILFNDGGLVLKLSENEVEELRDYIKNYPVLKRLQVKNQTYEVEESNVATTQTRYFNSRIHTSNTEDLVLAFLLTGLSLSDLEKHLLNGSLQGLPKGLTISSLNSFSKKYGRTPDIIRLAVPLQQVSRRGAMVFESITEVGDRVEMDCLESDFNETRAPTAGRAKKLPTFAGATAAAICVDCYSGYVMRKLMKPATPMLVVVKEFVSRYQLLNRKIKVFAADQGVLSQSMFQVFTPVTELYLQEQQIRCEVSEPYNHNVGTPTVERMVRSSKELQRMAVNYLLRNPNFSSFGFSELMIFKLWGELFHWSLAVINFKISPRVPSKSRYSAFRTQTANVQNIRLLPILSVVLVARNSMLAKSNTNVIQNMVGLYVGPSMKSPGAIRVAIVTNGFCKVIRTSKFTAPTDGGGLN